MPDRKFGLVADPPQSARLWAVANLQSNEYERGDDAHSRDGLTQEEYLLKGHGSLLWRA
jgi:hypothetical protein